MQRKRHMLHSILTAALKVRCSQLSRYPRALFRGARQASSCQRLRKLCSGLRQGLPDRLRSAPHCLAGLWGPEHASVAPVPGTRAVWGGSKTAKCRACRAGKGIHAICTTHKAPQRLDVPCRPVAGVTAILPLALMLTSFRHGRMLYKSCSTRLPKPKSNQATRSSSAAASAGLLGVLRSPLRGALAERSARRRAVTRSSGSRRRPPAAAARGTAPAAARASWGRGRATQTERWENGMLRIGGAKRASQIDFMILNCNPRTRDITRSRGIDMSVPHVLACRQKQVRRYEEKKSVCSPCLFHGLFHGFCIAQFYAASDYPVSPAEDNMKVILRLLTKAYLPSVLSCMHFPPR